MARVVQKGCLLYMCLVLCACFSFSDTAEGGSATETTNGIRVRIFVPPDQISARITATLLPANYQPGDCPSCHVIFHLDSAGIVEWNHLSPGSWRLHIQSGQLGIIQDIIIYDSSGLQDLGVLIPAATGSINGQIPVNVPSGVSIGILGTELKTSADNHGFFVLQNVPLGIHISQAIISGDTLRGYTRLDHSLSSQLLLLASESDGTLLFEDFEDQNTQHRFAAWVGEGWWYTSSSGPEVILYPSTSQPLRFDTSESALGRASAYLGAEIANPVPEAWASIGVQMGRYARAYSMSQVDSIVYWAKGNGHVMLVLHLEDPEIGIPSLRLQHILYSEWTRFSIPLDSMAQNLSNWNPRQQRRLVRNISWMLLSSGDFWIDDITFKGASRNSIWSREL